MRNLFLTLLAAFLVTNSCTEEPINITCADPLGSDDLTLNINSLSCFQPSFKGCFEFRLSNGVVVIQSVYVQNAEDAPLIFDVGTKECLKEVTDRPTSGGAYVVNAQVGHGYAFKMRDQSYGRLFIHSRNTSGSNVISLNVTRQYAY